MHCIWLLYGTNSTLQSVVKEGSGRELVTVPHGEGPAAPTSAGHTCCSVCAQSWSPWSWDCAAAWCPPATGSTPPEAPEDATLTPSGHPGSTCRPVYGLTWSYRMYGLGCPREDATLTPSSHPGSTRPGLCWTPSWGPCHPLPALTQNLSFFSGGDFLSQPEHTTCPPSMARAQQDKGEAWRARSSGPGPPGRAHAHSTCPPPAPELGGTSLPHPHPQLEPTCQGGRTQRPPAAPHKILHKMLSLIIFNTQVVV
jgi:hypothetical protein